jgi:hypothetical protein
MTPAQELSWASEECWAGSLYIGIYFLNVEKDGEDVSTRSSKVGK